VHRREFGPYVAAIRDSALLSGDVIVNNATAGPVLGEAALSLDRNLTTHAGFKHVATSIDLDQGAVASGNSARLQRRAVTFPNVTAPRPSFSAW
jgi:hypothetical protein